MGAVEFENIIIARSNRSTEMSTTTPIATQSQPPIQSPQPVNPRPPYVPPTPLKMKFQLLAGKHAQAEPTGEIDPRTGELAIDRDTRAPQTRITVYDATDPGRTRSAGNIIETHIDLCLRYNSSDPNMPRKFARIYDNEMPGEFSSGMAMQPGETKAQYAARLRAQAEQMETEDRLSNPQQEFQLPTQPGQQPQQKAAQPTYQQPDHASTLDAMSLDELKKHAEAEEISIGTAKTREQVLKVLKSAAQATSSHG